MDLSKELARELMQEMGVTPIGSTFVVSPDSPFCVTLELFVPQLLRSKYPAWELESIDAMFFNRAVRTENRSASLSGACILISDQFLTPIRVNLHLNEDGTETQDVSVRIGQAGGGKLGISVTPYVPEGLDAFHSREDKAGIEWVYEYGEDVWG